MKELRFFCLFVVLLLLISDTDVALDIDDLGDDAFVLLVVVVIHNELTSITPRKIGCTTNRIIHWLHNKARYQSINTVLESIITKYAMGATLGKSKF